MQSPNPSNRVYIIGAVVAALGLIIAAIISARSTFQVNIVLSTSEALAGQATKGAITQEIIQATLLAPTQTPFPTQTPYPTYTFQPTLTPDPTYTPRPNPTDTKSPIGLGKGDELNDNRVTLKLREIKYEAGRTRVGQKPLAPIVFSFDFTNNSGDTILVQLRPDKFRAEDNLGNKLTCDFWNGVVETTETLQYSLGHQQSREVAVFCGEGKILTTVTTYTLYVTNFSSLPDSTWIAEVAR